MKRTIFLIALAASHAIAADVKPTLEQWQTAFGACVKQRDAAQKEASDFGVETAVTITGLNAQIVALQKRVDELTPKPGEKK